MSEELEEAYQNYCASAYDNTNPVSRDYFTAGWMARDKEIYRLRESLSDMLRIAVDAGASESHPELVQLADAALEGRKQLPYAPDGTRTTDGTYE